MKRSNRILIAAAITFAAATSTSLAQSHGRIVGTDGQAIAFANVVALTKTDSTIVAAKMSDEKGYYQFDKTSTPIEMLRISALGYETAYYTAAAPTSLLTITLKPLKDMTLGEASVTFKRPVARIENGAIVTSIQNTSLSKAGNAEDVLRQVPGIIKKNDKDGKYEVIGSGEPQIYVNGRIVRNLDELKQIRSQDIKQVEVENHPGANYDASVAAIIRIKTVKRKGEGWGVNFSNDYEQGRYAYNDVSLRVNYQKNGLNVAAGAMYTYAKFHWISRVEQQTQTPDTLWTLPNVNPNNGKYGQMSEFAEVNYDFNEKHSVGVRYRLTTQKDYPYQSVVESNVLANGEYYDRLVNTIYNQSDNDPRHSLNAYYVGQWGKGEFRIDADFYASGSTETNRYDEQSEEHESRNFPTISDTRNRLVYTKAQYAWPWLKGKVTLGGQFNQTNRHDNYHVDEAYYGMSSSSTHMIETTGAAFLQYATVIAKKVQLSAGLRFEHLKLNYYSNKLRNDELSPSYDNLFPSFNLATQLGKAQMMLSYTSQTRRPSYSQLSNNVVYGNRFLLVSGNPKLKATISHDVSLTTVWSWVQLMLKYNHAKDGIVFYGESIAENPAITKVRYENKDYSQLTAILVMSPKVGFWNPTLTLSLSRDFFDAASLIGYSIHRNPMLNLNMRHTFNLPKAYDFTVEYAYTSRGTVQNIVMHKPSNYLECYLSKSFLKDALTLTIGGQDLLKKANSVKYFYMPNSRIIQSGEGDTRKFYLKLNYTFNAMRNKYKGDSDVNEVIRRM